MTWTICDNHRNNTCCGRGKWYGMCARSLDWHIFRKASHSNDECWMLKPQRRFCLLFVVFVGFFNSSERSCLLALETETKWSKWRRKWVIRSQLRQSCNVLWEYSSNRTMRKTRHRRVRRPSYWEVRRGSQAARVRDILDVCLFSGAIFSSSLHRIQFNVFFSVLLMFRRQVGNSTSFCQKS